MTTTPKTDKPKTKAKPDEPPPPRVTKANTLIALMRVEGGATAQALGEAVGWQLHSVRGFIAGNLKKRTDLQVTTTRIDGATRYRVAEVVGRGGERMSVAPAAGFNIASLQGMPLEDLRAVWRERFGAPPALRSPELLALMLAWRIQAGETGGLDPDTRRALRRPTTARADTGPSGGTKLVREWQGARHEVIALDDGGFLYAGARHKSLSQIARAITGTRWNGPRFFGLRQEAAG